MRVKIPPGGALQEKVFQRKLSLSAVGRRTAASSKADPTDSQVYARLSVAPLLGTTVKPKPRAGSGVCCHHLAALLFQSSDVEELKSSHVGLTCN